MAGIRNAQFDHNGSLPEFPMGGSQHSGATAGTDYTAFAGYCLIAGCQQFILR